MTSSPSASASETAAAARAERTGRATRSRFSTNRSVSQEKTNERTRTPILSSHPSRGSPSTNGVRTMSGQCHRYSEYDMSPTSCVGRKRTNGAGDHRPRTGPAAMTASAPATGSAAAYPGNGVRSV